MWFDFAHQPGDEGETCSIILPAPLLFFQAILSISRSRIVLSWS